MKCCRLSGFMVFLIVTPLGVLWAQKASLRPVSVYTKPLVMFDEKSQGIKLGELPEGISSLSSEACASCHQDIYHEWKRSFHAQAITDPIFQAAFKAEPRTVCRSCHSPLIEQHPKLLKSEKKKVTAVTGHTLGIIEEVRVEDNPHFDAALMNEGITCSICHVRDGVILTARKQEATRAPHPLAYSSELGTAKFCARCHDFQVNSIRHPFETNPHSTLLSGKVITDLAEVLQGTLDPSPRLPGVIRVIPPPRHLGGATLIPRAAPSSPVFLIPPSGQPFSKFLISGKLIGDKRGGRESSGVMGKGMGGLRMGEVIDESEGEFISDERIVIQMHPFAISAYESPVRHQETFQEFQVSHAARQGMQCQSCHMPVTNGHRDHTMPGAHDLAMLRRAVEVKVLTNQESYQPGDSLEATITLKATGVGHRFPTGDATHGTELVVTLLQGGEPLDTQSFVLRPGRTLPSSFERRKLIGERRGELDKQILRLLGRFRQDHAATLPPDAERSFRCTYEFLPVQAEGFQKLELKARLLYHLIRPDLKGTQLDPGGVPVFTLWEKTIPLKLPPSPPVPPPSEPQRETKADAIVQTGHPQNPSRQTFLSLR